MNRNVNEIKEILAGYFKTRSEIEVAYIFGSLAQGRINILSDIDIAIIIDIQQIKERQYHYGYKAEVLADLIKLLKTNKVDLVILNEANPLLRHRVLYFGRLIYSKNEKNRIQFQVDTINKYIDYKYLVKIH
jgi:predicted nucleotidyltransferase